MLSVMRITTLILMFGIGRCHLHWTVISPRVLPIFSPTLFLPKTGFLSNSLLCLGFRDFRPSRAKNADFSRLANSCIVREFPPFSFKVRIATLTRNQAGILKAAIDFITTHRQKVHCFLQLNICCSLLLFSPFSGEDFGGLL